MTEPEPGWWTRSADVPGLRPRLSNEFARALVFESEGERLQITFPWWDKREHALPFLQWLRNADEGDQFCDLDQGWRIDAIRLNERFHFLDQDFDTDEVHANVSVDREAFLKALDEAEVSAA